MLARLQNIYIYFKIYQMVKFFHVWSIKQILTLFLFSASAYYRDNWINNAAIIVCVGVDVRVWFVCVITNCVCVLVIFERDNSTVNHKLKHCVHQQTFPASNGETVVLRPNKLLLKAHFLRYQPQIWNTTCLDL